MRSYPRNSPHAAARIVALSLLADRNLCKSELEALERLGAHAKLGLSLAELHTVVHDLCQDLLAASDLAWAGSSHVDPRTLAGNSRVAGGCGPRHVGPDSGDRALHRAE